MSALKLKTPPAVEPVSLAELKLFLRIDHSDDDELIQSLITAARQYCELVQNRSYITQTWQFYLDDWPTQGYIELPRPPLQAADISVKYTSAAGTEYTFAAENYHVDVSFVGKIVLAYGKTWPTISLKTSLPICIEYKAGYGDAATTVPETVKQAIKMLAGHWYENRETTLTGSTSKEIEFAVSALLQLERVF